MAAARQLVDATGSTEVLVVLGMKPGREGSYNPYMIINKPQKQHHAARLDNARIEDGQDW
jgi:hypothetical protein